MEIRLLSAAQRDLDESYLYYEVQLQHLGVEFLQEILQTFKRIKLNPDAWSPFSERTRRCLVNRFPYGVIYQVRENEILIIAISHLHRNPEFWKERL